MLLCCVICCVTVFSDLGVYIVVIRNKSILRIIVVNIKLFFWRCFDVLLYFVLCYVVFCCAPMCKVVLQRIMAQCV